MEIKIENNLNVNEYNSLRSGKEEFYEKCGFRKIPFDYTGHSMIKRIEKGDE